MCTRATRRLITRRDTGETMRRNRPLHTSGTDGNNQKGSRTNAQEQGYCPAPHFGMMQDRAPNHLFSKRFLQRLYAKSCHSPPPSPTQKTDDSSDGAGSPCLPKHTKFSLENEQALKSVRCSYLEKVVRQSKCKGGYTEMKADKPSSPESNQVRGVERKPRFS